MDTPRKIVSRRRFLRNGSIAAGVPLVAAGLPAASIANVKDANGFLNLGWIGVGGRGTSLLDRALRSVSALSATSTRRLASALSRSAVR